MLLYTCGMGRHGATTPIIKHPCGLAAKALTDAGHAFELKTVPGYKNIPFSTPKHARDEIEAISGQRLVPVLVVGDGTVVSGSAEIVAWAEANPATA